jgi:uncharacterized protein
MHSATEVASTPARDPYRVVLRPLATPMPLGFLGQAVASASLASVQLQWISTSQSHAVAWAVLVFTVPLQALAAMLGYAARDAVASTGTALLAGGWAALSVTTLSSPPGTVSPGLGVVLICVGAVLLVPMAAGVTKLAAALVLLLSAARFVSTGVYEVDASSTWQSVAGWLGIALAAVSTYTALAFELEGAWGRALLPIGRFGSARSAQHQGLGEQLAGVATEPGVRGVL